MYSLGTGQLMEDVWVQEGTAAPNGLHNSSYTPPCASEMIDKVRSRGSAAERAYLDSFRANMTSDDSGDRGARFLPRRNAFELSEGLPSDIATGRIIMTAGLYKDEVFWCNLCSAYSGRRVQKLKKQCDRKVRRFLAVESHRNGINPNTGLPFGIVLPSRLCKHDVGTCHWSGEGQPDDNWSMCQKVELASGCVVECFRRSFEVCTSPHTGEDELYDPMGHGFDLG